jgi:lipoprotein-anchoring transpeptidase ErfK/SrfK
MSAQPSSKHFRTLLKFWIFVFVVSVIGTFLLSSDRIFSSQAKPVIVPVFSSEIPAVFVPRVTDIVPASGAQDVLLDIEDPIVVKFADSVKSYHIRFELDPSIELLYENNPEKTEFRLLPKEPLREGTRYTLRISYVSRETPDASYRPLSEMSFTTLASPVVPERSVVTRLNEALNGAVAKREGRYIDVDLTHQTMILFDNGQAVGSYLISSGKRGMDTPKGEFSIHNKAPRPWSKAYGLYMPYWMAFTADGKFGIHELPEWPGGYKEGANHLGLPVSHGCVRLGVGSAKEVYDWTETGTVVLVH